MTPIYNAFITETKPNFLKRGKLKLVQSFSPLNVFAEDGDAPPPTAPPQINYEDLIAKARKEEKDKLYPKITSLEKELENWTKKCNEHLIALGQKDSDIETLKSQLKSSGKDDTETVKALNAQIAKLTGEIETLKTAVADAQANAPDIALIEEKIKGEYEVKLYRETKLREVGDDVIPELVMGTTKEEIDASVALSQARFKEVSEKILGKTNTFVPASNVSTSRISSKEYTLADIAKLDPKSDEYREFRKNMGIK